MQEVENKIFGGIRFHGDFFQDDLLFLLEITVLIARVDHHISQQVQSLLQVLVGNAGVVACVQLAGGGVDIAADQVDLLRDLPRAPVGCAFKSHVLNKVGQPAFLISLHNGAGFDKHANGRAAQVGQALHHQWHAV